METGKVRGFYNRSVPGKYANNYEHERWFKNDIQRAGYSMTLEAIRHSLAGIDYEDCLELGPGAGTWTEILLGLRPDARYDLVDISSAMLDLARKKLGEKANIRFIEADFLQLAPEMKYDLFFSSRAIEYLPDKAAVSGKIAGLLRPGGAGFIITKEPHYLRQKLLGRSVPELHRGQIAHNQLARMLESCGLEIIRIRPATVSVPAIKSPGLNKLAFRLLSRFPINPLSRVLSESYCIMFKKPRN